MARIIEWFFASLLLLLATLGNSQYADARPTSGMASQDNAPTVTAQPTDAADQPALALLAFVPNTPEARTWITLGDVEAWHRTTGIPRVDDIDEARALPQEQRDLWAFGSPNEVAPPSAYGPQSLQGEDLRDFIGFNYFDAVRHVETGPMPNEIAVLTVSVAPASVADTLLASGYEITSLDGATLYAKRGDHEIDHADPSPTARMGAHNRIAILDAPSDAATTTVIVARATHLVEDALAAAQGDSLFDHDRFFGAIREAMIANAPGVPGELIGLFFLSEMPQIDLSHFMGGTPENVAAAVQALEARLAENPLSPWLVSGLATHRTSDNVFLTALLAFPPGADAEAGAASLAERLATHEDPDWARPFSEYWAPWQHGGSSLNGIPVAWATMKLEPRSWNAMQWLYLVMRRDLDFLIPAGAP